MNLLALLIGLFIERVATQLFHLRELRWLDRVMDWGFAQSERAPNLPALIPVVLLVVLLVLPVVLVIYGLGGTLLGYRMDADFRVAYLFLAVIVLFFSLGPKDIGEEVDEYCSALESGDEDEINRTAKAIIEDDVPEDSLDRIHRVEEAVCVRANNRLFAVIFWFILAGPLAAWAYRVTDLVRRRAVFNAARAENNEGRAGRVHDAATQLHGWVAWIPARLTAAGYAAAGHFDDAIATLRAPAEDKEGTLADHNERLLARVGVAALALRDEPDEDLIARGARGARAAKQLVFRLLIIAAVLISAMTLYGLTQ
jgi:AmpE protein